MEKRGCLIVLLLVLVVGIIGIIRGVEGSVTGEVITGDTITGEATQNLGMNISVIAYFPILSIVSPQNKTYLVNESLYFNYTVKNEQSVWYNLDSGTNTTITSNLTFNTSQGSHTLYLYANSSYGNLSSTNVTFFVNLTKFVIVDDGFDNDNNNDNGRGRNKKEGRKGQSTDFLDYTFDEIQNLSGIVLDNVEDGMIKFNQAINLTDDEDVTDNLLDIDTYVNISFNRIELNSTGLPNFNKSATLWLYNLTFSDPRILKDGSVCSSSECVEESYSGGTLKFNVSGFSVYSIEETPSDEVVVETPLGGGTSYTSKDDFYVDQSVVKVLLKQGELFRVSLKIRNTGRASQNFQVFLSQSLEGLVSLSDSNFILEKGEEKTIFLTFSSDRNTELDVYAGNLKVKADAKIKEIPVIFSVKSKKVLFDISLDIPLEYKEVSLDKELLLQLTIFNLADSGEIDVPVKYIIKDFEGSVIVEESEIVSVETQVSFSKTISLPSRVEAGNYLAIAQVRYEESLGSSSDMFYIVEPEVGRLSTINNFIIVLVVLIVLVVFIVWLRYEIIKMKKITESQKKKIKNIRGRSVKSRLKKDL